MNVQSASTQYVTTGRTDAESAATNPLPLAFTISVCCSMALSSADIALVSIAASRAAPISLSF
jgi:hypothetical protein